MAGSERWAEAMRDRGLRVTPQRSVILETISSLGGHPTAKEVYREAAARLPGLNTATVYRALEALREAGLVVGMDGLDGNARFAVLDHAHPHHHLVCTGCGVEIEVEQDAVRRLADGLYRRHRFRLHTDHLALTGLCRDCSGRTGNN